jgi:maltooligosyltrehalose trehalohydrolase
MVRRFIVENAVHWIREYHVDGLRLDATHTLIDESSPHIVSQIAAAAHAAAARPIVVHAEDQRNLAAMIDDSERGGWRLDGVWADDFHHVMRRLLAGDADGYYADFQGTTEELAATIRQGWLYTGQPSAREGRPRGSDPSRVPMYRFIVCLQNHDQIGNRATGDRLHHDISPEAWRAASAVLLTVPMTPLLFMGQEWATSAPFQYFTHLAPDLGHFVTEGRRREFADFPQFSRPEWLARIPDPQAASTFEASRIRWDEREEPAHAAVLRLYQALLALRREHRALAASDAPAGEAEALDADTIAMRRADGGEDFLIVAKLRGAGTIDVGTVHLVSGENQHRGAWAVVLTTEDALFATDPVPIAVDRQPEGPVVHFSRPGAIILRRR